MNKVLRVIKDWIWQLPQNLIGLIWYFIVKDRVVDIAKYKNYTVYTTNIKGAVSLGKYVFVTAGYRWKEIVLHESGHVKQSLILGPLYIPIIGVSSIIHASLHDKICKNQDYYHYWTEKWANKLANIKK